MIEVLVALALVSTLMAALGTYFVSAMRVSRHEAQSQAAARLAQVGMELARGYGGPTLLAGRAPCGTCLNVGGYDAFGYLTHTTRWDARVTGVTPTVPLPDTPETIVVNGVTYYRYYFVGKCWRAATGGLCGTNSTLPVAMVRLVIGVAWIEPSCAYSLCIRPATALFSANPGEPLFTRS
jgi:type II secretory pathway pseudopilin PulG